MTSGAVWLELSTASPAAARATAAAAQRHGVAVVDAPLGGGPPAAAEGRLLSFVGARADDLERVRPVLEVVADRIVHVGPPGSGYAVKLLANALWFGQAVATAEALTIATRAGLDAELVRAALSQSAASSRFLTEDARSLLDGDDHALVRAGTLRRAARVRWPRSPTSWRFPRTCSTPSGRCTPRRSSTTATSTASCWARGSWPSARASASARPRPAPPPRTPATSTAPPADADDTAG